MIAQSYPILTAVVRQFINLSMVSLRMVLYFMVLEHFPVGLVAIDGVLFYLQSYNINL